ncbi:alpha/beta hydrolase family protein [Anaeromyxobacter oryzae]|uniref:Abhydrolase domain-containing 18 n=1 Tax=Anaeromyxobacter oryzae TaxID=2918170 RepID=A0ABM7WV69_9BACT|nr:alpha/beta hydrolase family protein [Anaeromyxobacter oryzae]BDG03404.1 hypothetical protein AMOR_24000 [Anaeromyxobacter oryzae]
MHVLDLFFGLTVRGPRFFADGWGDRALCDASDPAALAARPPARIAPALGPPHEMLGGRLSEGTFESPEALLPACARTARFRLLLPDGPLAGIAVHLAASGDQGFELRLRFAAPLLAHGLGALVLENPYYGARRPPAQVRHAVRCVSDLVLLARATVDEARALLAWLAATYRVPVGVTGYSMGGQLAAMAGAATPFPVAVVPVAPSCSPDAVLRDGVLSRVADWAAIAGGAPVDAARRELLARFARFSVRALPPPVAPEAAIVVGTAADGVVPPSEMVRIAEHWGCELRWLAAGHVSAVLREQPAMREALRDAFARLGAVHARRAAVPVRRRARRCARGTDGTAPRTSSRASRHPA